MPNLPLDAAPRSVGALWRELKQLRKEIAYLRSARNLISRATFAPGTIPADALVDAIVPGPPGADGVPGDPGPEGPPVPLAADGEVSAVKAPAANDGRLSNARTPTAHVHDQADINALVAALLAKAPLASPTFTGTVGGVTKTHVGLSNVDNTTDAGKPVSVAQQAALDAKATPADITAASTTDRARANHTGAQATSTVTGLDAALTAKANTSSLAAVATSGSASDITTGTLPTSVLPALAINDVTVVVSQAAMLALTAQRGDMAVRTDTGKTLVLSTDSPGTLADWREVLAAGQVASVNGQTGVVVLAKADVGLGNVDNTTDVGKPVSTAQQAALDAKAPLASPAFTGTPTGITKTHVGLGLVDNTSDAGKPVSTAQATADALRELAIAAGTASQFWRGDKTWQALSRANVNADLRGWQFLGKVTGSGVTVGPIVWTGIFLNFYFEYWIPGYSGNIVGRVQTGAASISTTGATNGNTLIDGVTINNTSINAAGCPLAVAITNLPRSGYGFIRGASGVFKHYDIFGHNGTPAVGANPAAFRAESYFSDLSTNLALQRIQLTCYALLTGGATSGTFNAGTELKIWGRNDD